MQPASHAPPADRRARRTRAALAAGLIRLLRQKPLLEISVKELTDLCDINRSTFYLHYAGVPELLACMQNEMLCELNDMLDRWQQRAPKPLTEHSVPDIDTLTEVFQFLADRADFCTVMLGPNGDHAFLDQIRRVMRLRCLPAFAGTPDAEFWLCYVVSGCLGVLEQWMQNGLSQPPAEIARMISRFIGNTG